MKPIKTKKNNFCIDINTLKLKLFCHTITFGFFLLNLIKRCKSLIENDHPNIVNVLFS